MTSVGAPAGDRAPLILDYEKIVGIFVFIFVGCSAIGVVEPSPYDFASLLAMPIWFLGGFSVHRTFILFGGLLVLYGIVGFIALIPYWDNPDSALYHYQTGYLILTGLFYALYMGERSDARVELCLKAFTFSAFIGGAAGILGYFNLFGLGAIFGYAGRASGTLKDPNVLGSFLILSIVYLAQNLILGRARSFVMTCFLLAVIFAGMFLTFSRGSYGATIFSSTLMILAVYVTSEDRRMKRRILISAIGAIAIVGIIIAAMLSIPETREFFSERTAATQDYDVGPTGRFGNQLRSIPMLLERFGGFGPLRFRLIFDLDPHNSYVGAFANYGWIGGLLYILIVLTTIYVGLRMMFADSPVRRHAQVIVPTTLSLFMQGFQIDVDHWRHTFILLGAVWGLEAARQRWFERLPATEISSSSRIEQT